MTAFQSEWQERFGRTEPKVLCVGLNYSDHADESGMKRPAAPLLFGKFANTICGDGDAIALSHDVLDAQEQDSAEISRRVVASEVLPRESAGFE